MVASTELDAELKGDLSRALHAPIVAVESGGRRARRIAESERVLKAIAKQVAKHAGDSVPDRKSREAIRVSVYNTLTPVLLDLRTHQEGTTTRVRRALTISAAIGCMGALAAVLL